MSPDQVVADVLHHIEDEGHDDETALAMASDLIHALRTNGYEIVTAHTPPSEQAQTVFMGVLGLVVSYVLLWAGLFLMAYGTELGVCIGVGCWLVAAVITTGVLSTAVVAAISRIWKALR